MDFLQPADAPDTEEHPWLDLPLDPAELNMMLTLSGEEVGHVLAPLDLHQRLTALRGLQELRRVTADDRQFEEQVELNRAKKRARHEADRRDREERDAYLTSDEGRAAAAALFESELIDLDDIPELEPVIDGFLHRESLVRTFGPPKSLKSFVTLDMAACVSLGMDWQGRRTEQTAVLYVVAEGLRGVKKRRDAWNRHHGTEMKVIFYPKPVQLGDQEEMFRLIAFCRLKQVGYVIFDTQARCTVGIDENDNTEMGEIVASLDILKRETGACVHLVHHSVGSDPRKARGATAWDGAVDAEFYTRRERDENRVELHTKFQKDISEAEPLELLTLEVGASLVLERAEETGTGRTGETAPALVTEANMIYLEAIRSFGPGGATVSDITADLAGRNIKRTRTSVKKGFGALLTGGAVAQTGRGTAVVLTQAGLVRLDQARRRAPEGLFQDDPQE